MFYNKSTEIQIGTKHKTGFFLGGNQFDGYCNVPPSGRNNGHNQSVKETLIRGKYNPEEINKFNWKIDFDISSGSHRSSTLSLIANVSDNKAEGQPLLQRQNKSECSLIRGTKVVVPQSQFELRETYENSKCGNYNPAGCSKIGRLGGAHYQGLTARGQWSKAKAQLHINVLEMKEAKLEIELLCRVKKPNQKCRSPFPLGRNKECRTQQNFKGNLGVVNWKQGHTYMHSSKLETRIPSARTSGNCVPRHL